jgi:hypothetical protein
MENFKVKQIGQNIILTYDDNKLSKKFEDKNKREEIIELSKQYINAKSEKVKEKQFAKILTYFEADKKIDEQQKIVVKSVEKKIKKEIKKNIKVDAVKTLHQKVQDGDLLTEAEKQELINLIEKSKIVEIEKNEQVVISSTRRPE